MAARQSAADHPERLLTALQSAHDFLAKTRPTATNLFWALDHMMAFATAQVAEGAADLAEAMLAEAHRMADEDVAINQRLAEVNTRFANNVLADEEGYVHYLTGDRLGGLPESFVRSAAAAAAALTFTPIVAPATAPTSISPEASA